MENSNLKIGKSGWILPALFSLMFSGTCFAQAAEYVLYVSPTGNDANSGTSPTAPVLTLTRAHQILSVAKPATNVKVLIAPGTYFGQKVKWTYYQPQYSISFIPSDPSSMPVFDGCNEANVTDPATQCLGGTWFILSASKGQATNINISGLKVQNYWMAVSFNGNWQYEYAFNSNNSIQNCTFYNIGNVFNANVPYSYAAVRLYNSRNNLIQNNVFESNINLGSYKSYIHSIYAASFASNNSILGNKFINVSGDPVRLRDASNGNLINYNTFSDAGVYASASDWYCVSDSDTQCDKVECPSWNNQFLQNTYGNSYTNVKLRTVATYQSNTMAGCSVPTSTSSRFISGKNVYLIQ
jgi:hypothetical protein